MRSLPLHLSVKFGGIRFIERAIMNNDNCGVSSSANFIIITTTYKD